MVYYEVSIQSSSPYAADILMAELAGIGFESFVEDEGGLKAYIQKPLFNPQQVQELFDGYMTAFDISYEVTEIPAQNWNSVWESNFQPIAIPGRLHVRALFHDADPSYPMEIVIQPKMSFGTGHHATTYQVMELMLDMPLKDKKVMDFGTGTGILAILACKLGAAEVWAVDNDPQCVENAAENFEMNDCKDVHLLLGDLDTAGKGTYDVIIGNITRNIIIEFLPSIVEHLHPGGHFVASGFYLPDLEMISEQALPLGLRLLNHKEKDKWCAALFVKN